MVKQLSKISIIVPTLNQGQFIKETLDSLLVQDYPGLEIIVMDGGSTDNTLDILKSYGDKLLWKSEKDHGQTQAINKGIGFATGEILGFLNSDDILLPGALSSVATAFSDSNVSWVSGDYEIIDGQGKPIQSFVVLYKRFLRLFSSRWLLSFTNYVVQPSTFWRRELFDQIGEFDETLNYVMDYDFWMRAIQKRRPFIIHRKLSAFRIHQQSKGGSRYEQQFSEEIEVLQRYTQNKFMILLHRLSNQLIVQIYKKIK
jgi:glycosyltransferase involved in cell wall biosynthesis